ncbi:MAG: peptidoglycan DD-metalloendopeptidase family protein [Burkholderiales bacterium]|nr:peptidoglycan DD-metalloendopeptidase family protein [Burkholderiales bacterium]
MRVIDVSASRPLRLAAAAASAVVLFGCTSTPNRAPVEDRLATPRATVAAASPAVSPAPAPAEPAKPLVPEGAARPGYYTVKPGDTLIRIGLDSGQNWKDLVRWNNLENPNQIEVGQMLRVVAPGVDPAAATSRPVASTARPEPRPLDPRAIASSPSSSPAASAPAVAAAPPPAPAPATATARDADDDITWSWPAATPVSTPFDEARSKGLVFRGKAGDPVLAAADGRVVYAGSGLRGYGNLVILKHSATYLTAYAHNQTLLVKDDQAVKRGQKIAEMGSTDADSVQLHFEIRKQGKPIDPARLLPAR